MSSLFKQVLRDWPPTEGHVLRVLLHDLISPIMTEAPIPCHLAVAEVVSSALPLARGPELFQPLWAASCPSKDREMVSEPGTSRPWQTGFNAAREQGASIDAQVVTEFAERYQRRPSRCARMHCQGRRRCGESIVARALQGLYA